MVIIKFELSMPVLLFFLFCYYVCFVAGCRNGDVRLTGGSSVGEGTVEVCSDRTWGMVSGLGWSEKDARVVCRQLGLASLGKLLHKYAKTLLFELLYIYIYSY